MSSTPQIRCAIYTRKSSEEGLDQAFNSLDAQYEACSAYIASQRHEGWKPVAGRFDDGGLSGGTLERPALQRLLAAIDAGQVTMIVVYKIDRLTRSLADFARLVERLDAKGCSFVSVTQAFNTATSMGRLTLNVLLSFAQFEREVTAERIRDKIAASKQKGLWMGGILPIGYDRHPDPLRRELVVNAGEAQIVQTLFKLYAELGNLRAVEVEAARLGLRPKPGKMRAGRSRGEHPFTRGQLYHILTNPLYIGLIRHKDQRYPGKHVGIIDQDLWDQVQAKLIEAAARPRGRTGVTSTSSLLTGKLKDERGESLTPTHTKRHGKRFYYYVSNRILSGRKDPTGWRLPASLIEATLKDLIIAHLSDSAEGQNLLSLPDARLAQEISSKVERLLIRITREPDQFAFLISRVDLAPTELVIHLDAAALSTALGIASEALAPEVLTLRKPLSLQRRGIETRIIAGDLRPEPDPVLIRILAEASSWAQDLKRGVSLGDVAAKAGHTGSYIRTRLPFAFLSPTIQALILDGKQPPDISVASLIRDGIPMAWDEQARRFGIAGS